MSKRRKNVPFDSYYFEEKAKQGIELTKDETFREIYQKNHWNGGKSVSGAGASAEQIRQLEKVLPELIKKLNVKTFLDLPCGDFSWMNSINLPVENYIGADIVSEIIETNKKLYEDEKHAFKVLDLTKDDLPSADMIFCRDCLVHLSNEHIKQAIENFKRSQTTYLLTTTFPECKENEDIVTGDWRVINLEKSPFGFPKPLKLINEHCTEGEGLFHDKSLGLWKIKYL